MPLLLIGDCAVPVPVPGPRREKQAEKKKTGGGPAVVGSMHFGNKGGVFREHATHNPQSTTRHQQRAEACMHAARS